MTKSMRTEEKKSARLRADGRAHISNERPPTEARGAKVNRKGKIRSAPHPERSQLPSGCSGMQTITTSPRSTA